MALTKTKIPWADFSINPIKGLCPMDCRDSLGKSYCYARKMYKRFKWDTEIRYEPDVMLDTSLIPNGSKIFVGSTMELFGDWVKEEWLNSIFEWVKTDIRFKTYIFLTKLPKNVINYFGGSPRNPYKKPNPMPDNCWIGTSITSHLDAPKARDLLQENLSKVIFLSIEPLLGHMDSWSLKNVVRLANWVIIGSRTQPVRHPDKEWVNEIVKTCDEYKIPIFVKEPLASYMNIKRQEFPNAGE